jgi:hypothetical protein
MLNMAGRQNKTKQHFPLPCLRASAQLAAKTEAGSIFCILMEVGIAGKEFRYVT